MKFLKSFTWAFNGLLIFFRHERNGRIQLLIAIGVILLSARLNISATEWVAVIICIGTVIALEMLNSSLEKLCNMIEPNFHPVIKTVKDIAAAAVLWAAMCTAIAGLIIFIPKLIRYL